MYAKPLFYLHVQNKLETLRFQLRFLFFIHYMFGFYINEELPGGMADGDVETFILVLLDAGWTAASFAFLLLLLK